MKAINCPTLQTTYPPYQDPAGFADEIRLFSFNLIERTSHSVPESANSIIYLFINS